MTFIEQLPFFREQHGLVGRALGGWTISADYILASGQPYTPTQLGESVATSAFGNVFDNAFVANFGGGDSARPFIGSMSAPANTVGIFASDLCRSFFTTSTGAPLTPAADPTFSRVAACNTLLTPANALLSLNSLNIKPGNPQGGFLTGPGTQPGSQAPLVVTASQVRYIINGGASQQLFGTPFGNAPRNGTSDAIQNTANLSVAKGIKLGEHVNFEMRATAVNVLNHFNFASIDPRLEDAGRSSFGLGFANPALTAANGRQFFIGGRLTF